MKIPQKYRKHIIELSCHPIQWWIPLQEEVGDYFIAKTSWKNFNELNFDSQNYFLSFVSGEDSEILGMLIPHNPLDIVYCSDILEDKSLCEKSLLFLQFLSRDYPDISTYLPQQYKATDSTSLKILLKSSIESEIPYWSYYQDHLSSDDIVSFIDIGQLHYLRKEKLSLELFEKLLQKNPLWAKEISGVLNDRRYAKTIFSQKDIVAIKKTLLSQFVLLGDIPKAFHPKGKKNWEEIIKKNPVCFRYIQDSDLESQLSDLFVTTLLSNPIDQKLYPIIGSLKVSVQKKYVESLLSYDPYIIRFLDEMTLEDNSKKDYWTAIAISHYPELLKFFPEFPIMDYHELLSQHGECLAQIPSQWRHYDLCEIAVKQNGLAIQYVPEELMDNHILELAINSNNEVFSLIPISKLTYQICYKALEKDPRNMIYIPQEMQNGKIWMKFRLEMKEAILSGRISPSHLPMELFDRDIAEFFIEKDPLYFLNIPVWIRNQDMVEKSLEKNPLLWPKLPEEFQSVEGFRKYIDISFKGFKKELNVFWKNQQCLDQAIPLSSLSSQ